MKKRISRILGLIMLIIAIAFIVFALNSIFGETCEIGKIKKLIF